jgi:alpha-L-fucosidase
MKNFFLIGSFTLLIACTNNYTTNNQEGTSITLSGKPTRKEVTELATQVRPSYRQLDYQKREMLGFIHIGMNTFTGAEWGTGNENPAIFNPEQLNAEEWVKTFKDAGITGVILVSKHHDGFCVWPSKYTNHTVASSPWRNGQGDLVKEVADACKKYDMKFCIYLSNRCIQRSLHPSVGRAVNQLWPRLSALVRRCRRK